MRWKQITEHADIDPNIALNRLIKQVGHQFGDVWRFKLSDVEQQGLNPEFKAAKQAGLVRFLEQPDWFIPTR